MLSRSGIPKWILHNHINLQIILLILSTIVFSIASLPIGNQLSREHVGVRFEPPAAIENNYQYKKENLQVIIPIVASKFGTIAIRGAPTLSKDTSLETLNDSVLLIPIIIAEHNRKNPELFTECLMAFYEKPENSKETKNMMSSMETAKYVADFANAIHPGTVKTISWQGAWTLKWDEISKNLQSSSEFLKSNSGNISSNSYKLAVNMENLEWRIVDLARDTPLASRFHSKTLEYADAVVPHIRDIPKKGNLNPHERHKLLLSQIHECEGSLAKLKPTTLQVIPRVSCATPRNRDFLEIAMFLECWQLMSYWAQDNDRKVIMDYPFDYFGTTGWWRVTPENVKWVNTSSFIERASEEIPCLEIKGETAAYFDHRVRYHQEWSPYSETEIIAMLQLVSTRFTTIIITSYEACFESRQSSTILVAATLNKRSETNQLLKPLNVISTFQSGRNEISAYQRCKSASFLDTFHTAQSANDIFPGTVSLVVYEKFEGSAEKVSDAMRSLANAINLQTESIIIKLGAMLGLNTCQFVRNDFYLVSEWISVLIVEITGTDDPYSMDAYPDSSLGKLISNWTQCRNRFVEEFPDVEFQLAVDCSKVVRPTTASTYSSETIVRCWQIISEWGFENKIKVILLSAFDKHTDYQNDQAGWWRLKSKSEVNIKISSFVEITEDLEWDNSIYCNHTSNPAMTVPFQVDCKCNSMSLSVILPIVCLLLMLTAQGSLFVYLHGCNWKLFRKSVLNDNQELQVFDE